VSTKIRVLILEDRPEDAELMVHELRRSHFEPEWRLVDTETEYSTQLAWPPDIILSDYNMPQLDAPRAMELLRQLNLDIPFIVVSGAIGEDTAVEMMRHGATDYLLKDRLTRLGPAIRRALDDTELREGIRRAEQALRASEVRFSSFMNHSPALAFIKDSQSRILYINNTCQQMWGVTLPQCLGKDNRQLWPEEVAARLSAHDKEVMERGEASQMVEEVSLRNGRTVQILTFRFPFSDGDGQGLLGGVSIDISEQTRAQRALSSALAAKGLLLRELHHRVKNNLQIISSLLTMQAESLQDPAARQAFEDCQKRVQCMALIHERLNRDDDPDQLDFHEYVETLARDLFYSYGVDSERIQLRFELDPVTLGLNQAIPCGLILNELLTNCLKYAFPDGRSGEVAVKLLRGDGEVLKLTVADDGVGLPAEFDWQRSQSLGIRIMNILARQLDGTVESQPGAGTEFTLTFVRHAAPDPQASRPASPLINRFGHTA
jgi:PAS domain S-box-containing protein